MHYPLQEDFPTREERKELLEKKIRYKHYLDPIRGGVTIAAVRYKKFYFYGVSCCSPKDAFNKAIGRRQALVRLSLVLQARIFPYPESAFFDFSGFSYQPNETNIGQVMTNILFDFFSKVTDEGKDIYPVWLVRMAKHEISIQEYSKELQQALEDEELRRLEDEELRSEQY